MCLYLPRHSGAEAEAERQRATRAQHYGGYGETVLVVDDEPTVRMLIVDVLEEAGYHAIEAVDGASGLKVLQSDARIDLLVTDVGLPGGMNGRQVADAGRALRPELKVLFITGYAENAVVGNGHLEPGMQMHDQAVRDRASGQQDSRHDRRLIAAPSPHRQRRCIQFHCSGCSRTQPSMMVVIICIVCSTSILPSWSRGVAIGARDRNGTDRWAAG